MNRALLISGTGALFLTIFLIYSLNTSQDNLPYYDIPASLNDSLRHCELDSDCMVFHPRCCYDCGKIDDTFNKDYIGLLEKEKLKRCKEITRCPIASCMQSRTGSYETKPYCNENKTCDIRFDCEKICNKEVEKAKNLTLASNRTNTKEWINIFLNFSNRKFARYNMDCRCELLQ